MTHDYKRHGTVDLFAAMNIATGEVLTRKRLRRGVDTSVADLTVWAEHWNTDPKPFIWKATAENIIEKVQRGRETLSQVKSETDHKHARTP